MCVSGDTYGPPSPSLISSTLAYVGTIYIGKNMLEYQHLGANIRKVGDNFIIPCFGTNYFGIWAVYVDIVNMSKLSPEGPQ